MVEGFVNKVKWIKRSSYGQAGFPLLQHRVLLHPAFQKTPSLREIPRCLTSCPARAHPNKASGSFPLMSKDTLSRVTPSSSCGILKKVEKMFESNLKVL